MKNNKSDKLWYEKIAIWISIIASLFAILGISVFGGKSLTNNNAEKHSEDFSNNEIDAGDQSPVFNGNGNNTVIYNNYNENTSSSNSIASQKDTMYKSKEVSQDVFEDAMQHIFDNESIIKKEILNKEENKPTYSSIYPGVSYSRISNSVRLIEVTKGYRDYSCSRLYYFDENEKLNFALIEDDIGEHRLYFYNDILIRYKDVYGEEHDINYDLENFECQWTELALEESYEFFNCFNK